MTNLVIDIGNTFTKIAIFDNRRIKDVQVAEQVSPGDIKDMASRYPVDHAIVSSVDRKIDELEDYLCSAFNCIRFHSQIYTGINNHYKTPQTLGPDRLAAVIGASAVFEQQNCLVLDAGTCITYDFIDRDKNYYGGSISPGIAMRFQAMHTFTGRLPLIENDLQFSGLSGTDTRTSILSGVQQGALNEALGFIRYYSRNYEDLQIILCGGDTNFFDSRLKNSIFANSVKTEPHLVLIGLNEVIHQHKND